MTFALISDFENKVILHSFTEDITVATAEDLALWRRAFTSELTSWHSPYRSLIDCRRVKIVDQSAGILLGRMMEHFQKLYLNAVVGFGYNRAMGHEFIPFTVYPTEEEAAAALHIKHLAGIKARGSAVLPFEMTAYLNEGFLELSFRETPNWQNKALLTQIRQAAMQQLLKFHEPWTLLVDGAHLAADPDYQRLTFEKLRGLFAPFHLKQILGYGAALVSAPPTVENLAVALYPARHDALEALSK